MLLLKVKFTYVNLSKFSFNYNQLIFRPYNPVFDYHQIKNTQGEPLRLKLLCKKQIVSRQN